MSFMLTLTCLFLAVFTTSAFGGKMEQRIEAPEMKLSKINKESQQERKEGKDLINELQTQINKCECSQKVSALSVLAEDDVVRPKRAIFRPLLELLNRQVEFREADKKTVGTKIGNDKDNGLIREVFNNIGVNREKRYCFAWWCIGDRATQTPMPSWRTSTRPSWRTSTTPSWTTSTTPTSTQSSPNERYQDLLELLSKLLGSKWFW